MDGECTTTCQSPLPLSSRYFISDQVLNRRCREQWIRRSIRPPTESGKNGEMERRVGGRFDDIGGNHHVLAAAVWVEGEWVHLRGDDEAPDFGLASSTPEPERENAPKAAADIRRFPRRLPDGESRTGSCSALGLWSDTPFDVEMVTDFFRSIRGDAQESSSSPPSVLRSKKVGLLAVVSARPGNMNEPAKGVAVVAVHLL